MFSNSCGTCLDKADDNDYLWSSPEQKRTKLIKFITYR